MGEFEKPDGWHKSSFSLNGDCVEWAFDEAYVYIRNSRNPANCSLQFTVSEWRAFVAAIKSGEGDMRLPRP
jgi:hypothetical protein